MPRRARLVLPNVPLHVIQRGNNRQACFLVAKDYRRYLEWLREYADQVGCRIHAYVLMTNHVHLLLSADRVEVPGALMKALGQRYTQYFNRTYQRSGTLWEGRFRSCLVQAEDYLLVCQRYIELNPVRAGMVAHPADYPWSSYRANAQNDGNSVVRPHEVYQRLGQDIRRRQTVYRDLFLNELDPAFVNELRQASNGNYVMGAACFGEQVAATLGRRATPGRPGRPRA